MKDTDRLIEDIQEEVDRIRTEMEPKMLLRGVRLVGASEVPNVNASSEPTTFNDRVASFVTSVAGNILFAYVLLAFALSWMTLNVVMRSRGGTPYDVPWEFPVMLLASNFIQLMMPIFIMVSQRRQERRDRIRADRDHLVMLIGKRDVLVMFSYFDQFSRDQEAMLQQMRASQQKMLAMERSQGQFMELTPKLLQILSGMQSTLEGRPCILRDLDREAVSQIIEVLSRGGHDDGSTGDAEDPAGGQGREPMVGVEHVGEGGVGEPGEG